MPYGFVRLATATPDLQVADCAFNAAHIADMAGQAEAAQVQAVCFPELCTTGYTCADLFLQEKLIRDAEQALAEILRRTATLKLVVLVGMPIAYGSRLLNAAVVLHGGEVMGVVPKCYLPNSGEFYERRWFTPGTVCSTPCITFGRFCAPLGTDLLFDVGGRFTFGVELCEDLWAPIPPSSQQALHGAEVLFNLSASNELVGKQAYRRQLVAQQSARCIAAYAYASAGAGESTTDMVFTGNGIIAENGRIVAEAERFSLAPQLTVAEVDVERLRADRRRSSCFACCTPTPNYRRMEIDAPPPAADSFTLTRPVERHPFVPPPDQRDEACHEIFSIQVGGLSKRWRHTQAQHVVLGVSGGLDSTLALLVCAQTCDKLALDLSRIIGVTMPGFGTTPRTHRNAASLMKALGVAQRDIPIRKAALQHFKDIGHDPDLHDITYENTQARERTQVLMDLANQHNGLVVGTGDLSELALGWATYNGDHMSMYAVNSGIPKTLVRHLVAWAAQRLGGAAAATLKDVLATPVSPELLPAAPDGAIAQQTEAIVGPYELHDFFLYYFVRWGFSPEKIAFLANHAFRGAYPPPAIRRGLTVFLRRFFSQQFKRSCMPDGPKVGAINLSPRGDWRMPSDAAPWGL
ncbi:MAG: NAD(+) synthase [Prevotellaceae bacterium]|jgi:NAD+ synthase (glutamine-hydrolysing)|nr:NAD(+) synthase [Prevotellaceae bacterium]